MTDNDELVTAAREALPILESLVSCGSATWLTDDLERIYSSLKSALPREHRCRDCNADALEVIGGANFSDTHVRYYGECQACGQRGMSAPTERMALEAASTAGGGSA